MKPIINLDELELVPHGTADIQGQYGVISDKIGAKQLGYNLTICPPGKKVCPFHNHHVNEEMFLVLEGEGVLRFGDQEYPLRRNDVVACPAGGPDVAHQIINTGTQDLKYLALSTRIRSEVCEYPDSQKVGVYVGEYGSYDLRAVFHAKHAVDHLAGES